ncbi:MAG: NFYB/HAP3 family transcription factor subunit [Methanomicrobiales archaeon]|nr:NFYB/HAP3 family transcription factor subunit [Methanomicrobiales archaeon]
MADLPIAAVVRIAKANGAERVGSDAAAALVKKTEKYIAHLTKEANKLALHATYPGRSGRFFALHTVVK